MTAIIHLQGHLGKDCEVKTVNDHSVVNLALATSEHSKNGDKTTWWRLGYWETISDKFRECLKKGAAIYVIGLLKTPSIYTDSQGDSRSQLDVKVIHLSFPPFGEKDKDNKTSSHKPLPPLTQTEQDDYLRF